MYHGLLKEEARQGKYVLSPAQFESDLKYLKENGYHTVVVQDLIDYVEKGVPLPEKPVMLTFDDAITITTITPFRCWRSTTRRL